MHSVKIAADAIFQASTANGNRFASLEDQLGWSRGVRFHDQFSVLAEADVPDAHALSLEAGFRGGRKRPNDSVVDHLRIVCRADDADAAERVAFALPSPAIVTRSPGADDSARAFFGPVGFGVQSGNRRRDRRDHGAWDRLTAAAVFRARNQRRRQSHRQQNQNTE